MMLSLHRWGRGDASSLHNDASDAQLVKWYTKDQLCIIQKSREVDADAGCSSESLQSLGEECNATRIGGEYFYSLSDKEFHLFCPMNQVRLSDREMIKSVDGYEDRSILYFTKLFDELSAQNRGLLMTGDSINRYMYFALQSEARRLGYDVHVAFNLHTHKVQPGIDLKKLRQECLPGFYDMVEVVKITSTAQTHPGEPPKSVHVYFPDKFQENLKINDNCFDTVFESLRPISVMNPEGLVIMSNIGPHYSSLSATELRSELKNLLSAMHRMTLLNPKHTAVFRETAATHFPTTNGLHEKMGIMKRQGTMYPCRPLEDLKSAEEAQAPENQLVRDLVREFDYDVKVFPLWADSASWTNMHHGYFSDLSAGRDGFNPYCLTERQQGHRVIVDCRHWCGYAPNLWEPIWDRLGKLVLDTKP
jgi:hypothetical protein